MNHAGMVLSGFPFCAVLVLCHPPNLFFVNIPPNSHILVPKVFIEITEDVLAFHLQSLNVQNFHQFVTQDYFRSCFTTEQRDTY